jgi:hypothetical protein
MPTPKKTTTPPKPKPTAVRLAALVRVSEHGSFHVIGWGDKTGPETDLEELRADADNYVIDGKYEEYLIEIEVPAYSGFAAQPRFKLEAY